MTTAEHIKHLQGLINLSSMTKQEKDIIQESLNTFIFHLMKGGNNE